MKVESHNLIAGNNPRTVTALKMSSLAPQADRPIAQNQAPVQSSPNWARYIDSRMKQFTLR